MPLHIPVVFFVAWSGRREAAQVVQVAGLGCCTTKETCGQLGELTGWAKGGEIQLHIYQF